MSERGSFVTEYMYCDKCFESMKKVLCQNDKYLYGRVIPTKKKDGILQIIAGKLGSLGSGGDTVMFQYELFNKDNAPCHPVKVALIPDSGEPRIMTVFPSGTVDEYDEGEYEGAYKAIKDCDCSGPSQEIGDYLYCIECGRPIYKKSKTLRSDSPKEEIKVHTMKFIVVDEIAHQRTTEEIRFGCYCGENIILCRGDDIKECKCGRKYRLALHVEIEEK